MISTFGEHILDPLWACVPIGREWRLVSLPMNDKYLWGTHSYELALVEVGRSLVPRAQVGVLRRLVHTEDIRSLLMHRELVSEFEDS